MIKVDPALKISGSLEVPGDKSISHRLLFFGAYASGETHLQNVAPGDDVKRTILALKKLGVKIQGKDDCRTIIGRQGSLMEPSMPLDCRNSGTTARLLMGILAAQSFYSVIYGDRSLHQRPMGRVTRPLGEMGAQIYGRENGELLPITIRGDHLCGRTHRLEVASAQVKTALLLAGLRSEGETRIAEPLKSRDHAERLLKFMGADLEENGNEVRVRGGVLHPARYKIPGDFSSASFFVTLGLLHPKAELEIHSVGLNPTRTGLLEVFKQMGGQIEVNVKWYEPEPLGTIRVKSSCLRGIEVAPDVLPRLIDEIPLLALAATQAEGKTKVTGAHDLRRKESDRIRSTVVTLRKLGAHIEELPDGFEVEGPTPLRGCILENFNDHRITMMQGIAGTLTQNGAAIVGDHWIRISYPSFFKDLSKLIK